MKIALLSMPFLSPQLPSLGLTQIKARLKEIPGEVVEVKIFYINHDFYNEFGPDLYLRIHSDSTYTFINDWIFRTAAFPGIEDNSKEYLSRFYPGREKEPFRREITSRISQLDEFIGETIGKYDLSSYDLVGMNCTFSTMPSMACCRHLKSANPDIITVLGGATLYKEMGRALSRNYPHVDYVNSGSGLISFPQLVESIIKGDGGEEKIDGVFTENNHDEVGILAPELDINRPLTLDYDDFFDSLHRHGLEQKVKPRILMETSRGCYWRRCKFCGLNEDQLKYRVKKPSLAIEEINTSLERYQTEIEMVDNVMPANYREKVVPFIHNPGGISISYEVRADFDEEQIKGLAESGIRRIQPGIETFCTGVHELMNKGVDAFQCLGTMELCMKHGILAGWNLMIGFPGMTGDMYEYLLEVIPKLVHLIPPIVVTPVRFDRYSTYWMESEKYDLDLHPFSPYQYSFPYSDSFSRDFSYYYEDRNYTSRRFRLLARYFGKLQEKINMWKGKWVTENLEEFPGLYIFTGEEERLIRDTRYGEKRVFHPTPEEEQLLSLCNLPQTEESLRQALSGMDRNQISGIVSGLLERDLIIEERNRLFSLVIDGYDRKNLEKILSGLQRKGRLFHKYIKA